MQPPKIDHNVPIPDKYAYWGFDRMGIGDSFSFDASEKKQVGNAAQMYKRRNPDFNYTIRRLRIWRISTNT